MARIHLLKDCLINKIAAGEVVERPASVLKELIENSIDAGADRVKVELKEGGRDLIVITDNGVGIAREDAPLALARHATSKIHEADDLFTIDTMGFRGEALAAISSVSRFSMLSRRRGADVGVRLDYVDGSLSHYDWNGKEGTSVTVKDLFHNVPVRRGFLKKPSSELAHCHELVHAMSINLPEVGFSFWNNGKKLFHTEPLEVVDHDYLKGEAALRTRSRDVLGKDTSAKLLYVTEESEHGSVEALISPPGVDRGTAKNIFTYVNGRWVKDKSLRFSLTRSYHSYLLKGRYPCVVLRLSLDPSLVDVNVHPSKMELRFQYASEVQNLIVSAIRKGIRAGAWAEPTSFGSGESSRKSESASVKPLAKSDLNVDFCLPKQQVDKAREYPASLGFMASPSAALRAAKPKVYRDMSVKETKRSFDFRRTNAASFQPIVEPDHSADLTKVTSDVIDWLGLTFIGSFSKCYLLFDAGDKLLAVDQHAFHERILYERFVSNTHSLGAMQPLLVAEEIEIGVELADILTEHHQLIVQYGFDFKIHKNGIVEVLGLPSLLAKADIDSLFSEISEHLHAGSVDLESTEFSHKLLSTMACHGAVRAGEFLSREDVNTLMKEAEGVDFVMNCPHGRRVFKWWKKSEVGAWFDR